MVTSLVGSMFTIIASSSIPGCAAVGYPSMAGLRERYIGTDM
jgi:hypothetical protein